MGAKNVVPEIWMAVLRREMQNFFYKCIYMFYCVAKDECLFLIKVGNSFVTGQKYLKSVHIIYRHICSSKKY